MLTRAGEVCAGVIIVIERAKIEVDLLSVIAQHLPAAAQGYAINAVRNEPPHEVLDDLVRRLGHRPQYCYLAFDFAVEGYRERTPRIDPNIDNDYAAKLVKLPFFFEVFPEKEKNLPGKDIVTSERSILGLGKRLDPEKLLQNRQRELLRELQTDLRRGIIVIETNIRVGGEVVQNAATKLFNTCKDLFSEGDQSTVKLDLESIKAIADSLQRTATWEFKLLLWPCRGALSLLDNAKEKLGEIKKWIHSKRGDSAIPSASTRLTSSNLCQALAEWSAACGSVRVAAVWEEDAQEILNRFSKEERTILADSEWDEATSKLWEGTPKWKQRIALVTGLVAGLLALASAIADFLGGMGFFTVTYAKLLSILGIGGGAAALGETGWRFRKLFAKLTKQQISNFFAITADRIGVPRTVPETFQDEFPAPLVLEKPNRYAYGITERHWQLAHPIPDNLATLRSEIDRLTL